ncbi:MAG: hypothetical protein K2X66_18560, partial [Cyanobacteria bacterium]|nr:hypothetical protein [Cyanobacteriota bacterium]
INKRANQAYYVALNGINEAIATRMLPRSNQLSFVGTLNGANQTQTVKEGPPGAPAFLPFGPAQNSIYPVFPQSGRVYNNPINRTGLVGLYRYIVVGGDPAISSRGQNYITDNNLAQMVENEFARQDTTPYTIISNGFTCLRNGVAVPNSINIPQGYPGGYNPPTCAAGSTPNMVTLVKSTQLDVRRFTSPVRMAEDDIASSTQIFNGATFNIPTDEGGFPQFTFVPGYGFVGNAANIGQNLNFERVWNPTLNPRLQGTRLNRILIYLSATRQPVAQVVLPGNVPGQPGNTAGEFITYDLNTGAPTTRPNICFPAVGPQAGQFSPAITCTINPAILRLPNNASFKLMFDGPLDYRSAYNYSMQSCLNDRRLCKVRLSAPNFATVPARNEFLDFNFLTLFPASTQLLVTPTFRPVSNPAQQNINWHRLAVSELNNFSGLPTGVGQNTEYRLEFLPSTGAVP